MGGHIHGGRAQIQDNFQQIMTVQPQDRPPVGMDIPDLLQLYGNPLCIFQPRKDDKAVHLPHFTVFLVDGADLAGDDKPGIGRPLIRYAVLVSEHIHSFLRGLQFLSQFFSPSRMGKVAGSHNMNPFPTGPQIQMLRGTVFAGGSGIAGMNMQICNVHSVTFLSFVFSSSFCLFYHITFSIQWQYAPNCIH